MQSGTPDSASINNTSQNQPDLATIKPEAPQVSQNAPLANAQTQVNTENLPPISPKSSFGDILAKENLPTSANTPPPVLSPSPKSPPTISSTPSKSFGDILAGVEKKIESTLEPSINIPPIEPPNPSSPISPPSPSDTSSLRQKANQKRLEKRQKHFDEIMQLIKQTGTITNTDVQRLCRVSQSTATNYLSELTKKGILKKQGIRGGAKYSL